MEDLLQRRDIAKRLRLQASHDHNDLPVKDLEQICAHPSFVASVVYTQQTFKDETRGSEVPYFLHPFDVALTLLGVRTGYVILPRFRFGKVVTTTARRDYCDPYFSILQALLHDQNVREEIFARVLSVSFNHDTLEHRAGTSIEALEHEKYALEQHLISRGSTPSFARIVVSDVYALSNHHDMMLKSAKKAVAVSDGEPVSDIALRICDALEMIGSQASQFGSHYAVSASNLAHSIREHVTSNTRYSSQRTNGELQLFEEEAKLLAYQLYLTQLSTYVQRQTSGEPCPYLFAIKLADASDNVTSYDTPDPHKMRRTYAKATLVASHIQQSIESRLSSPLQHPCNGFIKSAVTELYCAIVQAVQVRYDSIKRFRAHQPRYHQLVEPFKLLLSEARQYLPRGRILTIDHSIYAKNGM